MTYTVYTLYALPDCVSRYVGKTKNPLTARLAAHLRDKAAARVRVGIAEVGAENVWIRAARTFDTEEEACKQEAHILTELRRLGVEVWNKTRGGERVTKGNTGMPSPLKGRPGPWLGRTNPEHSARMKGRPSPKKGMKTGPNPAHSARMMGRKTEPRSEETRERIRQSMLVYWARKRAAQSKDEVVV